MPRRYLQFTLLLVIAWSVFVLTHEGGHIIGGWLSGGTLAEADLLPWHLPHSRFAPDPHPLVTVWSGPLLGAILPVALALAIGRNWAWLIAYFCLLANGTYLAVAWVTGDRLLDTARLLDAGAWSISIVAYCALTISAGYVGFRRECVRLLTR